MSKRTGVIGILVTDKEAVPKVNSLLSEYSGLILGRIGLPRPENGMSVISLIVEGTNEEIGALTGKLGTLSGITGKSLLLTK